MNGNKCIDLGVRAAPAKQRSAHGAALSIKKDSQITHAAIVGFDFFSINFRKRKYFWGKYCKLFVPLSFFHTLNHCPALKSADTKAKKRMFCITRPIVLFLKNFWSKNNLVHSPKIKQNDHL